MSGILLDLATLRTVSANSVMVSNMRSGSARWSKATIFPGMIPSLNPSSDAIRADRGLKIVAGL